MPSIYERALGTDFKRLHPRVQERFSLSSGDARASIGVGSMHRMWNGPAWSKPLLAMGARRRIMFPESHDDTSFVVENYAYRDALGRETVSWIRTFDLPARRRRFDTNMVYSERRGTIVEYLGSHQHIAVDLDLSVDHRGGLCIRSGDQRLYEHLLGFRLPRSLTGDAHGCEWYDDLTQRHCLAVDIRHHLFGYEGTFEAFCVARDVPLETLPRRLEIRE